MTPGSYPAGRAAALMRLQRPEAQRCLRALEELTLEEPGSLNRFARETRSDDEFLRVYAHWQKTRHV